MARISGVDLPREKRVEIGLTYIYGIPKPFFIIRLSFVHSYLGYPEFARI